MASHELSITVGQFARFAFVGIASNAALFILYLLMTHVGFGHKLAATLCYAAGVLQTFFFNRSWSFRHGGSTAPSLIRYIAAYALGYALNVLALLALVDRAGLPHQWVQAATIVVLAAVLFLLQKFWVFREH